MSEILKRLFVALRHYLRMEKRFVMLTFAEKATVMLSMMIIVFVLIMMAMAAMTFALIGMAHWLGDMLQSIALGYLCAAGVLMLIAIVFYVMRHTFVINPLARFMSNLIEDSINNEEP